MTGVPHCIASSTGKPNPSYSDDAAGNLALSSDQTFTTGDATPPVISGISATGITGTGATISWTTNEPANGQVEYGVTTAYGTTSALQAALTTPHTVTLSGLTGNTLYHYRIRSADAAGNLALSSDQTFTTSDTIPPSVIDVTPANGATRVARSVRPRATFSEAMNPATLTTGTVTLVVDGSVTPVSATVSYNTTNQSVTLRPSTQLSARTRYVVRITGGSGGAKDVAGNALSQDYVWSFTTR
jgi:hypothetical protein